METKFLKQSKINFSKEVNNYYPEILTDEALNFLLPFMKNLIKKDYRY
jgi:malate synthase